MPRRLLNALVVIWVAVPVLLITELTPAKTLTFQQGHNGYERALESSIRWGGVY